MWSEHYMFSDLAIGQGSTQYDNPPYSQYQTSSWDVQSKYSHEVSQPTYQQLPYPSLYNPSAMDVSIELKVTRAHDHFQLCTNHLARGAQCLMLCSSQQKWRWLGPDSCCAQLQHLIYVLFSLLDASNFFLLEASRLFFVPFIPLLVSRRCIPFLLSASAISIPWSLQSQGLWHLRNCRL